MSLLSRSLRRRSCRTKLAHCKQISACSERQLDSPHNYSQRRCTHTPQRRPDRVRAYIFVQPQQLLAYERKRQLQHTVYGPPQVAAMRPTVSSSMICVQPQSGVACLFHARGRNSQVTLASTTRTAGM